MRIRLYTLIGLFLSSAIIFFLSFSPLYSGERPIDVRYSQLTVDAKKQVDCLAENIYYEAGWEPQQGKVAVALVTLNRVQDPRYPKDICSVVKQKTKVEHIGDKHVACQFSWFCQNPGTPSNNAVYNQAKEVALYVYGNYERMKDITYGALYYHADYVNPRWRNLEKTTTIGRHIFYKERGSD